MQGTHKRANLHLLTVLLSQLLVFIFFLGEGGCHVTVIALLEFDSCVIQSSQMNSTLVSYLIK